MMSTQVVVPAPLGPSSPTASPRCSRTVTSRSTGRFLNCLPMLRATRPSLCATKRGPAEVWSMSGSSPESICSFILYPVRAAQAAGSRRWHEYLKSLRGLDQAPHPTAAAEQPAYPRPQIDLSALSVKLVLFAGDLHVTTQGYHPRPRSEEHTSEERRVGKECVSTCRSRWSPYN